MNNSDCVNEVLTLKKTYENFWRNEPDRYWFWKLLQEVVELGLSLLGLHRHHPEKELAQIASICMNWIDKNDST